jgi:hypothetical protein
MAGLDARERAQLGLKNIQDAIEDLLSTHVDGLAAEAIAEELGLADGLAPEQRNALATALLGPMVATGRIFHDETGGVYRDNPDRI